MTRQTQEKINQKIKDLKDWLKETAPECSIEQNHLDKGTQEQIYWHYGYLSALVDIKNYMEF